MLYFSKGNYQTSHYAFCTAISYLGLMLPGMVSGWMKDALGYRSFFIIVMALCVITFAVTGLERRGFTTAPLFFSNDSINNGKEIFFSLSC